MARTTPVPGDPGLVPLHLFTDAACQGGKKHQTSAWAAMLVMGQDSNLQAGHLQRSVTESLDAELLAIAYALDYFLRAGMIPEGACVIVHTDNQTAAQYVNGKGRPRIRNQRNLATVDHIEHLVTANQLTLTCEWVKGHQGFDATCWRGLMNARVDREARKMAKAQRLQLKSQLQEASAA